MMTQEDNYVKILFRFHSDVLDEETVETMWAIVVNKDKGYYKLDSIPFYAPLVASDDIVFAEFDEQEQMLTYWRLRSKFTTISAQSVPLAVSCCS
jgi:hypothetical protein